MYEIIKNVLNAGGYDLTKMLKKITGLWLQGTLTDAEYEELNTIARGGAKPENSVDMVNKITDLENRVRRLENGDTSPVEGIVGYPEYAIGKWYYNGDKVSFEGKNYVCIAPEGTVCVWSPKEYPAYWEVT
ncbi:MAG: hypothetical protein U0M06_02585 [Clostridia bacterium]|nr:hypothetical protein [Clostridia bacterium]